MVDVDTLARRAGEAARTEAQRRGRGMTAPGHAPRTRVPVWRSPVIAGLAVLVGAAVLVLGGRLFVDSVLVIDPVSPAPTTSVSWPVAVRYETVATEVGQEPQETVVEFVANGWDDWMLVSDAGDGRLNVHRYGPDRRESHGDLPAVGLLDEPFAASEAALHAPLTGVDRSAEPKERLAPTALLHPRLASEPQPDAQTTLTDDLPDLREEVAQRLGLDPDATRSARQEFRACDLDEPCAAQTITSVWLTGSVPLYAEDVDADGSRSVLIATHMRSGLRPPPNPAHLPPPLPPLREPGPFDGTLSWSLLGLEFSIPDGSVAHFEVYNDTDAPLTPPTTLQLERYEENTWTPVGMATSTGRGPALELPPDTERRLSYHLPDQTEPTYHRLRTIEGTHDQVIAEFWYAGDPNQ